MRTIRDYAVIALKGMGMGAADVVPGVSGGTIAFITGIYEELIDTISQVNIPNARILLKGRVKEFWKAVNGNFILALGTGIAVSIITLAQVISYLLTEHPIAVWSFFFGLVVASIPLVARRVKIWTGSRYFAFAAGAIMAFLITELPPVDNPDASWYIFISGAVAICAMILPGISGSFILVLMGSYLTVLDAVNDRDLVIIAIFGAGAVLGLFSFSRLLKWMFNRFHDITIAVLSGFLLGSLNKIWPWKNALDTVILHPGEPNERAVPRIEENLMPWNYTEVTGHPSELLIAGLLCAAGLILVFAIDRAAATKA